jgi:mannitol-specific phosphotransferase system IIBC component
MGMPTLAMVLAQRQQLQGWIWKSMVAGLCGVIAHTLLISIKVHAGWLPSFQPYQALQRTLSQLVGSNVSPIIPWAISYLNGMTVVGLLFGSGYRLLPGRHGITKGLSVGVLVWLIMGSVFFPLVGLGFFAFDVGLGFQPTLFSLTMVETYSAVMGAVFALLNRKTTTERAAGRTIGLKVKRIGKHPAMNR